MRIDTYTKDILLDMTLISYNSLEILHLQNVSLDLPGGIIQVTPHMQTLSLGKIGGVENLKIDCKNAKNLRKLHLRGTALVINPEGAVVIEDFLHSRQDSLTIALVNRWPLSKIAIHAHSNEDIKEWLSGVNKSRIKCWQVVDLQKSVCICLFVYSLIYLFIRLFVCLFVLLLLFCFFAFFAFFCFFFCFLLFAFAS